MLFRSKIHPNSKYDYSLVNFLRMDSKVQIICSKHGIFQQTPNQHIRGKGCYKCKNLTKDETIKQFQKVHQDKYDYSLVDYKNSNTKVKIICPKHGIFEQRPSDHKRKAGCPICSKEYQKINEEVRNNDELKDMITKEQALFQMINDVQQAMTKPIGDLYDDLKAK